MREWYAIDNVEEMDTPALVVYPDRVKENIRVLKNFVPDTSRLRPHVKTNKSEEVSRLIIDAGITKFKCATISEAEMLALAGAKDVLLAYQPVGPKATRLLALKEKYPATQFSCLIDNLETANHLSAIFLNVNQRIPVYIDLNVGMNRTGITPENAYRLYTGCQNLKGLNVIGLHAYDGHIRDTNFELRSKQCDESFAPVEVLKNKIIRQHSGPFTVIAGGTPTFPIHAKRKDVECSPGTFIYWDIGYQRQLPDQPFVFAALVVTRVISKPTADTLCVDLGHKSIASENPIESRVFFLNAPELQPIGHSEEHMVVRAPATNSYNVGDVLFGVPFHICPTCALYDSAWIVENNEVRQKWAISSRNRIITI
jgi:D-serine deaminase-like pyridoxal phosphate-dependent protein